MMKANWRSAVVAAATFMAVVATGSSALALEKVRVAKATSTAFAFATVDVGIKAGIWESVGLELEVSAFRGDAQVQQALTSNSIDIGLGSGPGMGAAVKGVPAIAVAAFAGPPRNMALIVTPDGKFKSSDDLKGARIGVNSAGSLTDFLVRELSRQKGWGAEGIEAIPMGEMRTRLAAMAAGELDGTVQATSQGYELEEEGLGSILVNFGDLVKDFHTHVIFARNEMIEQNPDTVRKFLEGWFRTVAYMKANKDFTVAVISETINVRPSIVAKTYDAEMSMMSDDGVFNPEALETIRNSLVELGILDTVPEASQLYMDRFVPVRY